VFKRLFWLVIGAGFGLGASFWVARVVRDTVARYSPERVSSDLATAARGVGVELRAALAEGRQAMRDREAELRARVSPGREP
jgi:hypothetical protein